MTNTLRKEIEVEGNKFTLEIYPAREGCNGVEGPYFEIFAHDYNASLYAFSNKQSLNDYIKKNHIAEKK